MSNVTAGSKQVSLPVDVLEDLVALADRVPSDDVTPHESGIRSDARDAVRTVRLRPQEYDHPLF